MLMKTSLPSNKVHHRRQNMLLTSLRSCSLVTADICGFNHVWISTVCDLWREKCDQNHCFRVRIADGALGVSILFLLEANPFASRDNLLVWGGAKWKCNALSCYTYDHREGLKWSINLLRPCCLHCSLTSGGRGAIMQPPGVDEFKKRKKKKTSFQENLSF